MTAVPRRSIKVRVQLMNGHQALATLISLDVDAEHFDFVGIGSAGTLVFLLHAVVFFEDVLNLLGAQIGHCITLICRVLIVVHDDEHAWRLLGALGMDSRMRNLERG